MVNKIDEYYDLLIKQKYIAERLETLKDELVEDTSEGDMYGTSTEGVFFRVTKRRVKKFSDVAINKIVKWGVAFHLIKLSDTAIQRLQKKRLLTIAQVDELNKDVTCTETLYLVEKVLDVGQGDNYDHDIKSLLK